MEKSIIEKVKDRTPIHSDQHIAQIIGRSHIKKRTYYRNMQSGEEYWSLEGGIGWSGKGPAFALIVAAMKGENNDPALQVLEERENQSIEGLLSDCFSLQEKYGANFELLRVWWGDQERFSPIVADFNQDLKRRLQSPYKDLCGIHLACPDSFDESNALEIYIQRVKSCLQPDEAGRKKLYLGNCDLIRGHIQNLPSDAAVRGKIDDYPAVSALGFIIHMLLLQRPWLEYVAVRREPDLHTIFEIENKAALDALMGDEDPWDDEIPVDDGDLTSTVYKP